MRKAITKQEVEELQGKGAAVKLIDIRSLPEYEQQHIPGAINIPSEKLMLRLPLFNKSDVLVCICNHGKERSQQAAETLYINGFEDSFYLDGGTAGWLSE